MKHALAFAAALAAVTPLAAHAQFAKPRTRSSIASRPSR